MLSAAGEVRRLQWFAQIAQETANGIALSLELSPSLFTALCVLCMSTSNRKTVRDTFLLVNPPTL